jgi:hypothetical protein
VGSLRANKRTHTIPHIEKLSLGAARIPVRSICELSLNRKPIMQASVYSTIHTLYGMLYISSGPISHAIRYKNIL